MLLWIMLVLVPPLLIGGLAALHVHLTFKKYSQIRSRRGYTGAEAAAEMLHRSGVQGVNIEMTGGTLSDHYDPLSRTLRLSRDVYQSPSLAAIGIACHEAGHAIQHARHFAPLWARTALVPVLNVCSRLYMILFLIGMFAAIPGVLYVAVTMAVLTLVFAVVTLPVEWDASRRAKLAMAEVGLLMPGEQADAGRVLNAAFLTYLGAVVTALLQVLYYVLILSRRN